jgi:hypothetical protein
VEQELIDLNTTFAFKAEQAVIEAFHTSVEPAT